MRKPNYNMERKDRERAKQAKAAAKLEKRSAKSTDSRAADGTAEPDASPEPTQADTRQGEG